MSARQFSFAPWNTPFGTEPDPVFALRVKDENVQIGCEILVETGPHESPRVFRVSARADGVRVLDEKGRLELWTRRDELELDWKLGGSFEIIGSPWIAELREFEPYMLEFCPDLRHFVLASWTLVIELLAETPPMIVEIDPSAALADDT